MNTSLETLESRDLFSAGPLAVTQITTPAGRALVVTATPANDNIHLDQTAKGLRISDGQWSTTLAARFASICVRGGAGDDTIVVSRSVSIPCSLFGDGGNDTLIASNSAAHLVGGAGDDTLVSVTSRRASLRGGSGQDSFWTGDDSSHTLVDATRGEEELGNVHRIRQLAEEPVGHLFATSGSASLAAARLPEPLADGGATYKDFGRNPLFAAAGPLEDDISQGNTGDCYFLAALSATARTDPNHIRQSIAPLGDGTYLVELHRDHAPVYLRVDAKLPTDVTGQPAYAGLGHDNATWVALIEKAFCFFRTSDGTAPAGSYANISSGYLDEAFEDLGANHIQSQTADQLPNAQSLTTWIQSKQTTGQTVLLATLPQTSSPTLLPSHAYTVDHVDGSTITLRNPWGNPAAPTADPAATAYITLDASTLLPNTAQVTAARILRSAKDMARQGQYPLPHTPYRLIDLPRNDILPSFIDHSAFLVPARPPRGRYTLTAAIPLSTPDPTPDNSSRCFPFSIPCTKSPHLPWSYPPQLRS